MSQIIEGKIILIKSVSISVHKCPLCKPHGNLYYLCKYYLGSREKILKQAQCKIVSEQKSDRAEIKILNSDTLNIEK